MDRTNDSEVQATARETVQDREARLAQRRQPEIEPEGSKHAVKKRLNRGRLGWLSKDNEIELEGSKHEVRKELNRGRQGWLNEDNEIEPGENKKQLNKGMLG